MTGDDPRLYALTAHLVMDEEVVAYNQNYPFKTSPAYRWFIAAEDGRTLGFLPVKLTRKKAVVNNYYVADDDNAVFTVLLREVLRRIPPEYTIEAMVQIRHKKHFERSGFHVHTFFTNYARMIRPRS